MFLVPGTRAWLGNVRKNQEALTIPGPTRELLSIWVKHLFIMKFHTQFSSKSLFHLPFKDSGSGKYDNNLQLCNQNR